MTSAPSGTGPGAAAPATGNFRRSLARRVAFCAALLGGAAASAAAGWWLQAAMHPDAAATPMLVDQREHADEQQNAQHGAPAEHAALPTSEPARESTVPNSLLGHAAPAELPTAEDDTHGHAAAVSSTEPTSHQSVDRPEVRDVVATPEELARAAELGEQHLLDGSPADALREFDLILEFDDRSLDGRFHYRCGVCAESLGEFDRALTEYGVALAASQDETLGTLCRLGQARVWRSLGHVEMGSQLLAAAWLTSSESKLAPVVRPFTAYLFADVLVAETLESDPPQLSMDEGVQFPAWQFDLFDRAIVQSIRDEDSKHAPVATGIRVLSPGATGGVDVTVQARLQRMGLMNVVDALCRAAELRTDWSGEARQATSGRSTEICLARGSLSLCLDALTAPLGLVWEQRGSEIRLSTAGEVSEGTLAIARRHAARRALEHAVKEYPEFVLGPQALVALGNMALQDGQIDVAEHSYRQMLEKYPRSPIRADAWFNLSKLELLRNHPDAALESFWQVVDSGAPPVTAAVAYLYIGRLLLDAEQPRRAVTPLTRATQWTTDATVRTKAVLCLAAAHLLHGKPEAANEVLMDFRSDVRSESKQAAFLSALARYRAAVNPTLRLEEAQSLLSAADPLQNSDFFGRYGWYIRGQAYEELLLPELAVAVYREALEHDPHPPYRDAIIFGLGSCLADINELDAARLQLTTLIENAAPDWQRRAAFRLCRLQLDCDEPLASSRIARALVGQCDDPGEKSQALQLLGAAYQQLGDHAAAALCFAGTVPGNSPSGTSEKP